MNITPNLIKQIFERTTISPLSPPSPKSKDSCQVECPSCSGRGQYHWSESSNGYSQGWSDCDRCNQTGKITLPVPEEFYTEFKCVTKSQFKIMYDHKIKTKQQLSKDIKRMKQLLEMYG